MPNLLKRYATKNWGMDMPGRSFTGTQYAFGYQGSLKADELGVNQYTTYFREPDCRIMRWTSPDPVNHPWQSPYCVMDCNPVALIDPMGAAGDNPGLYQDNGAGATPTDNTQGTPTPIGGINSAGGINTGQSTINDGSTNGSDPNEGSYGGNNSPNNGFSGNFTYQSNTERGDYGNYSETFTSQSPDNKNMFFMQINVVNYSPCLYSQVTINYSVIPYSTVQSSESSKSDINKVIENSVKKWRRFTDQNYGFTILNPPGSYGGDGNATKALINDNPTVWTHSGIFGEISGDFWNKYFLNGLFKGISLIKEVLDVKEGLDQIKALVNPPSSSPEPEVAKPDSTDIQIFQYTIHKYADGRKDYPFKAWIFKRIALPDTAQYTGNPKYEGNSVTGYKEKVR